ncbi:MAG: hypothetical protein M3125_09045, partial [Gemmatimonadota bacterium]|nr:hypothetical protein [Gemmatimonadota bacterium]
PADEAYERRRAELVRELETTQQRLSELRGQRVQLQARIENVLAAELERRAQALMMTTERDALIQLDAVLTASQDNLLAQRERFRSLGDAVRRRTGAVLVVLLRADSAAQGQTVTDAQLEVDGAVAGTRTYSPAANEALRLGAVDQLYRSDVLPTRHAVRVQVTVNGQRVVQTIDVNTQGETVTYLQFAVRNGQLVPTTWTSRGTTPF